MISLIFSIIKCIPTFKLLLGWYDMHITQAKSIYIYIYNSYNIYKLFINDNITMLHFYWLWLTRVRKNEKKRSFYISLYN